MITRQPISVGGLLEVSNATQQESVEFLLFSRSRPDQQGVLHAIGELIEGGHGVNYGA